MRELRGARVLVTGATGFIGGRLVEKLVLEHGSVVRALVSSYTKVARVARFPVELHRADILDPHGVARAAVGCEVIFHLAYGSRGSPEERRRVTVEGTRNVIEAARSSGARIVHVSSQAVYGDTEDGDLDESAMPQPSGSSYAESKLEAERLVLAAAAEGIPVTVLQPSAVYGPYAPVWTVGVIERLKDHRFPLVNGGDGWCNAVYVDDAVQALLAAAGNDEALGEAFLISASEPTTWREFFAKYEVMLGIEATFPLSLEEALADAADRRRHPSVAAELLELVRELPEVRRRLAGTREGRIAARVLRRFRTSGGSPNPSATPELDLLRRLRRAPEPPPVYHLDPQEARFYARRSRIRIDKAQRVLGYRPAFDLEAGMRLTAAWARWANLVPHDEGADRRGYPAIGGAA